MQPGHAGRRRGRQNGFSQPEGEVERQCLLAGRARRHDVATKIADQLGNRLDHIEWFQGIEQAAGCFVHRQDRGAVHAQGSTGSG